ncbi:oxidoreductase [Paenibacillus albidus]|uniref:Oxidoreductase n=1 Tax=Paenibacillus albidus TaxID=2041023 RepID=A0A917D4D4_9BACL|nr:Gfo/Idh/MocA family oxidoreductase [Paenibacillus albidus]GGG07062.1 oxidoreductase [Paenibacillus albidus]
MNHRAEEEFKVNEANSDVYNFTFAVIALDHIHIYGMCGGLTEAGATMKWVYDPDPHKVSSFLKNFPQAKVARSIEEILEDSEVKLVASAAVPSERWKLGMKVMSHGKDYFTDKTPFVQLSHLEEVKRHAVLTGRKYMVYFNERVHSESVLSAKQLISEGQIGRVLQVIGLGPHRLNINSRPDWFFRRADYGGILCDLGSQQIDQFLYFTDSQNVAVSHSNVANYNHPAYPELEDFGDCIMIGERGECLYFRVDWFTPAGLSTWGDGRSMIMGTDGFIEIRKNCDIGRSGQSDHIFWSNRSGEHYKHVKGQIGFPFFKELIMDCLWRTENAMTQSHVFRVADLCLQAQANANHLTPDTLSLLAVDSGS